MSVAVLLVACAGSVWLALRRPATWLGVCLTVAMLPLGATRTWVAPLGGLSVVPPATWLMITGAAALLLDERRVVSRGTWSLIGAPVGVTTLGLGAVWAAHGQPSATALLTIWVLPMAGLVAVLAASTSRGVPDVVAAVAPWVSALAAAEAALAVIQRVAGDGLVFEQFRTAAAVYQRTGRSAGTFDTPLDLAAFLTLALVVVVRGRGPWLTWSTTVLIAVGTVCSGSRTGMVLVVVIVCLGVAVRGVRKALDLVLAAGAALAATFIVSSAWAEPLFDRFGARGERSSWARDLAQDAGLELVRARPVTGSGLIYSYEYTLANLPSSFEDAWLSLAIGAGLPVTALFIALPVLGWLLPGPWAPLTRAAGAVPLLWGFSYSAYTATSTFGVLAWSFLGFAATELLRAREAGSHVDQQ